MYFILQWHSTCVGRSFRPSSGVQECTYSNRHLSNRYCCLLDKCLLLYVKSSAPDDGRKERPKHVECHSKMDKYDTAVHVVGFNIEIILRCTALWTSNLNVKRVQFVNLNCPHKYATRFDLYSGHPQACQYKNINSNIQQTSKRSLFYFHCYLLFCLFVNRVRCLVNLVLSYSFVFMHIRVLTGVLSTYAYDVIYIVIIHHPPKWVSFFIFQVNKCTIYIYRVRQKNVYTL